jgi:hypothetical protein
MMTLHVLFDWLHMYSTVNILEGITVPRRILLAQLAFLFRDFQS